MLLPILMLKSTLDRAYRIARIYRAVRELNLRYGNPFTSLLDIQVGHLPDRLIGHLYTYSRSDGQTADWIWNSHRQQFYNLYRTYRNGSTQDEAKAAFASIIRGQYRLSGKLPS